jgi:anti-anti-sigma factor
VTEAIHDLHVDDRPDVVVARLTGEIDQSNAVAIGRTLRDCAKGRALVLDLSAARYLDSAGIAMLDMLRRTTSLRLILSPESIVKRALTITGFDQLIPIFPSMEAANL